MQNNDIVIRKVNDKDGEILKHLATNCYPLDVHTPYTYWVISNYFSEYSFIAYDSKTKNDIGFITCIKNDNVALIWQIGVLKEYRKRGISQFLIDSVVKSIFRDGSNNKNIEVTIAKENEYSYKSFEKYCQANNLSFIADNTVKIKDIDCPQFYEEEIKYIIKKL